VVVKYQYALHFGGWGKTVVRGGNQTGESVAMSVSVKQQAYMRK